MAVIIKKYNANFLCTKCKTKLKGAWVNLDGARFCHKCVKDDDMCEKKDLEILEILRTSNP